MSNGHFDETGAGLGAGLRNDADRLGGAVVAMLEVLLSHPDAGWREALAEAALVCVRTSHEIGLPGFAGACEAFVRTIRSGEADGTGSRSFAENWVSEAITFSAGALEPAAVQAWLSGLEGTEGLSGAPAPTTLAEIIYCVTGEATRLGAGAGFDAGGEIADAGNDGSDLPWDAAVAPGAEPGASGEDEVLTVARDELAMLAQACNEMIEEFDTALLAFSLARDVPEAEAGWSELLERYGERVEAFANAVGFVGVETLADLLRDWVEGSVQRLAADPGELTVAQRDGLRAWPRLWADWLVSGEFAMAEPAFALQEAAYWPAPSAADAARRTLGRLRLIASRQVMPRVLGPEDMDLSNEIPTDAEHTVVANLLHELPALTQQFGEHVAAILAGDRHSLAAACRVAHTLKGAANTVGIAGIANLTHSLEDVLQILTRRGALPEPMRGADLADAADCLAEMAEALAGGGVAPANAPEVFERVIAWADALAREEAGEPAADDTSFATGGSSAPLQDHGPEERLAPEPDRAPAPEPDRAPPPDAAREPARATIAEPGVEGAALGAVGDDEWLRVPAKLMDVLLDYASEATILLSQVQESAADLEAAHRSIQTGSDRLVGLSDELERLVDASAETGGAAQSAAAATLPVTVATPGFDSLELQSYGELHTVSRRINEAAADGKLVEQQVGRSMRVLRDLHGQVERLQADIREAALRTRMVAASTITARLRRVVRQAARMVGKEVDLQIEGGETNIEIRLLQALTDPLGHLLRNAVDHGIEPVGTREAAGKPTVGTITLSFERTGPHVIIRCQDDGRGLDRERVRARAFELGLGVSDDPGSDRIGQWILTPGFSTRPESTQISGRGIGLDVVQRAVRDLRGRLEVEDVPGRGLCFTLTLPVQLAALPVLVARSPTHVLALSVRGVREILSADGLAIDGQGERRFAFGSGTLQALRLEEVLGLPAELLAPRRADRTVRESVILVGTGAEQPVALIVPELAQTRSVVVRPMPSYLSAIPGIEGVAVLGDGAVAPVIDLPDLLATRERIPPDLRQVAAGASGDGTLRCLVVDDSVSVRRTMELFLRDLGFEVDNAADGIEALGRIERIVPDLVVVDLEMPRMNGVELTRALRGDERTAAIPIIMVTSRSTEKHRQLALAAGVDAFLVKPYDEDEFASLIADKMHRPAG